MGTDTLLPVAGTLLALDWRGDAAAARARQEFLDEAMRRAAREMMVRIGGTPAVDMPGADLTQEEIDDYPGRWHMDMSVLPEPSQVEQQIEVLESRFGPMTDDTRTWIESRLESGMSIGQAVQQLARLREDWRP